MINIKRRYKFVDIRDDNELKGLLIATAYGFFIISSADRGNLQILWTAVFFVMLLAVPAYSWLASKFSRGVFVPLANAYSALSPWAGRYGLTKPAREILWTVLGAENSILPLARDRGIAVLVNLPFARGGLFKAVADQPLPDWAADMDAETWGQVFLKYVISYPASTLPIPSTTKPHHAKDNMGAAFGRLPDADLRREIEKFIEPLL